MLKELSLLEKELVLINMGIDVSFLKKYNYNFYKSIINKIRNKDSGKTNYPLQNVFWESGNKKLISILKRDEKKQREEKPEINDIKVKFRKKSGKWVKKASYRKK